MIILDSSTKSLEIVLDAAKTTNDMPVTVSFKYVDTSCLLTAQQQIAELGGESDTTTNGVTPVTILSAPTDPPAATEQYQKAVEFISVVNEDTAAKTVTIRLNNNGTYRTIFKCTLDVGDQLQYSDD